MKKKMITPFTLLLAGALALSACGDPSAPTQKSAQERAQEGSEEQVIHVTENNVEFNNYNRRQVLADDPTTILWCTSAFSNPSSALFTVPIVGKITSGGKRPYPTEVTKIDTNTPGLDYHPELPGPDKMYGSSGEYRYGFTPADFYADWYNLETFCTDEPLVWQREETIIAMQPDAALLAAQERAQAALADGDTDAAYDILSDALGAGQ